MRRPKNNTTDHLMKELTIIVPLYNEEESISQFKIEMDKFIEVAKVPAQVLFVNDGSTDKSDSIIQLICEEDSNYNYISLTNNCGLSTAIKAGIDYIDTPLTGYIDADLQTSPSDFNSYLQYLDNNAMVNGIRAKRHDSFVKKMSSKIANSFRRFMIDDNITDTCCPLKIMKSDYAKKIPFFKGMHRFMPALIQLQGGSVKQLEVQHFERYAGTAKYHLWNRIKGPFFDTLAFVWIRKRYIRYQINNKFTRTHRLEKGVVLE